MSVSYFEKFSQNDYEKIWLNKHLNLSDRISPTHTILAAPFIILTNKMDNLMTVEHTIINTDKNLWKKIMKITKYFRIDSLTQYMYTLNVFLISPSYQACGILLFANHGFGKPFQIIHQSCCFGILNTCCEPSLVYMPALS